MAALQINSASLKYGFSKLLPVNEPKGIKYSSKQHVHFGRCRGSRVVSLASSNPEVAVPESTEKTSPDAPPQINFIFVSPESIEDGELEVQRGLATGGQKLRDIMLENNLDLYGPYKLPLLNCGGGGTCGTCLVEILQGQELLSERTSKEKEKLKKMPKNWRLACQTVVGDKDSVGKVVVQRLPEFKQFNWI